MSPGAAPGSVRRAAEGDLEAAVRLWLALGELHGGLEPGFAERRGPRAQAAARRVLRPLLRDADAALFVHEAGAGVDGLCLVRVARAPEVVVERERGEISDLYVEPAARRAGVGRVLVETALTWLRRRGVPRVTVRVAVRNTDAQAFWRALGWRDFVDVLERRL